MVCKYLSDCIAPRGSGPRPMQQPRRLALFVDRYPPHNGGQPTRLLVLTWNLSIRYIQDCLDHSRDTG